jgi:ABC-2 type transport system permease protein
MLMGFLFDNLYNSTLLTSYDYYGVTMVLFAAMMGAMVPPNLFLGKQIKSANTRIFYTPTSRISIYGAKILACFACMSIALILVAVLFQITSFVNFGGANIGYIIALLLNLFLFLTMLSSAICVSVRSEEITSTIISNSSAVLGFLSGIMFPIANLGKIFEKIASYSPLTWTMDSIFQLIYDGRSPNYWFIMLGLLVLSLLLLLVVHKKYQPKDYM